DAFVAARSAEGVETVKLSQVADADDAPAAKPAKPAKAAAPAADTQDDAKAGATKTQPYGPGSKAPLASGNAPKGHEIKGNEGSKKYHVPGGQWYDQTDAE